MSVNFSFELLVLLTVPMTSILLVMVVIWLLKRAQRDLLLANQLNELSQQQVQHLQTELAEVRAGFIGLGQRVLHSEQLATDLQQQLQDLLVYQQQLAEQQQKIELIDPDSRLYNRAVKMVQLGAPLEEVMRECELPRAEAELLFNLHSKN